MEVTQLDAAAEREQRFEDAIRKTAPGTPLRTALDMILAGHLGALICVGDTENVLAAGDDGFKLDVSFTANRLFELSKMDGAVVVDRDLTKILRANYHLNPNPSLPTSETGMRHRTAARMSLLTSPSALFSLVNQLTVAMQNTRSQLDRSLLRLTSLELDNVVTLGDLTNLFYLFEVLMTAGDELDDCIIQLGSEGRTTQMQRDEYLAGMDEAYTLMIRDYAVDSSEETARTIRKRLHDHREHAAALGEVRGQAPRLHRRSRRGLHHDPARPSDALARACGARRHGRQDRGRVRLAPGGPRGRGRRPVASRRDWREEPRRACQQPPSHVGQGGVMGAPSPVPCPCASLVRDAPDGADVCAIVVAGGSGERFGDPRGKQFVDLCGLPLMSWSIMAFDRAPSVARIVVVCAPDRAAQVEKDVLSELSLAKPVTLAPSGATRQDSVRSGLDATPCDLPLVAVHDAARPLIEVGQIEECVSAVRADESLAGAILAARSVDTLKLVEGNTIVATPDRSFYWAAQTPQVFRRRVLLAAHKAAAHEDYQGTDDASLVERLGGKVRVVESTRDNIKITLPEDLALAEATLERRLLT